ncbi:MAG: hypothetical protein KF809_17225 [Chloroflexi bacterium]|nr:hypothetical protein [Chloroflexota bacterium]
MTALLTDTPRPGDVLTLDDLAALVPVGWELEIDRYALTEGWWVIIRHPGLGKGIAAPGVSGSGRTVAEAVAVLVSNLDGARRPTDVFWVAYAREPRSAAWRDNQPDDSRAWLGSEEQPHA